MAVEREEDEAVAEDGLRDGDGHDRERGEREERAARDAADREARLLLEHGARRNAPPLGAFN